MEGGGVEDCLGCVTVRGGILLTIPGGVDWGMPSEQMTIKWALTRCGLGWSSKDFGFIVI